MRCKAPIKLKVTEKLKFPYVPCNQCLHCRLNRRDKWVTRILLESRASITAQFWTLTFSDENLSKLRENGERKLFKNFLSALRMKETRAGNPLPIRYFGVLEYGEILHRPHYHVVLFNHTQDWKPATPYLEGLPRPKYIIPAWPHGHVDICDLTLSSARYVAKYVTKFEDPSAPQPVAFYPKKPPLGLSGLVSHVEKLSRSPGRKWIHSETIELDGRKMALDSTMLKFYRALCKEHGLKTDGLYENDRWQRKNLIQAKHESENFDMLNHRLRKEATRETLFELTRSGQLQRQLSILERASKLAALR